MIFGPDSGIQACGDIGEGRMQQPDTIVEQVANCFETGQLSGKKVVITAGPTREAIDPVRYISNHSSGKMGYSIAAAAVEAGAQVTIISGPVALSAPDRCTVITRSAPLICTSRTGRLRRCRYLYCQRRRRRLSTSECS